MAVFDPRLGNEILHAALVRLPLRHQHALALLDPRDHLRQTEQIVRPEDHVDDLFALEDGLAFLLGDTTAHPDDHVRPCPL